MFHITEIGDLSANWLLVDDRIVMVSFTDKASIRRAAYQVRTDGSIADFPGGAPGTVYFSEGTPQPDLAQVREWFPGHFSLWDAVRAEYWDAVLPLNHPRLKGLGELAAQPYRW
ncbi:hypothetical protein ACFXPS_29005 [Nocardia sp. NPDC059091]|uniref:hypothetical protein n=1 Tax=unclassified Nocardia TaxID=2637762 RepID=UPI003674166B